MHCFLKNPKTHLRTKLYRIEGSLTSKHACRATHSWWLIILRSSAAEWTKLNNRRARATIHRIIRQLIRLEIGIILALGSIGTMRQPALIRLAVRLGPHRCWQASKMIQWLIMTPAPSKTKMHTTTSSRYLRASRLITNRSFHHLRIPKAKTTINFHLVSPPRTCSNCLKHHFRRLYQGIILVRSLQLN